MAMPQRSRHFYEFGPFRLDADKHRLLREGELVHLSPKAVEALIVLVQNAGKLLERDVLMQAVWADTFVEDANLTVAISHLRKALGQNGEAAEYIETIPRIGYRFVAEVREAYEEPRPLIMEKHTQSRTVIEEELLPDHHSVTEVIVVRDTSSLARMLPIAINRRLALISTGAILILAIGSFLYFRRGNERNAAAINLAASGIRSIAVLPPKALSNESENPALSLGIADALIARLGGIHKLAVRPTSAVVRYVGLNQDSLTAGRALGVDAVIDGTLQRDQGRMRVRLRLLGVSDGQQLWAGTFDEADADIFKLQDSISQQLTSALYSDLSQNEKESLSKQQTANAEAYALYLQGNYFWNKRGDEAGKSIEYFRKAIELDPNFAQAYASLAAVDATGGIPSPEAEALIDKALRLDDSLAKVHATLAFIKMFHLWDWAAAETELNRAIELDPNSSVAHHWKGTYLSIHGRLDEAKAEMHRALELDPLSLNIMADIGQLHYFAHEYDQAIEYCNKALALDPEFRVAHWYLLDIYWAKGADEAVLNELPSLEFRSSTAETKQHLRQIFERGGLREIVAQQIALQAREKAISPLIMVGLYSRIGDKDHPVFWLDRAVSEQRMFLTAYTGVDPLYDPLRTDPRFKSILNRIGLGT